MGYITTQKRACFKIQDRPEGTVIESWKRTVERDADGNPTGVVSFEANCTTDAEKGRCELEWKMSTSDDGSLTLTYLCTDVNCLGESEGGTGCILQYSSDGIEYFDVTADEPPASEDCYFRCKCSSGG